MRGLVHTSDNQEYNDDFDDDDDLEADYDDDDDFRCRALSTRLIIKNTMMISMMMTIWKRIMMMTMTLGAGSCPHVRPC